MNKNFTIDPSDEAILSSPQRKAGGFSGTDLPSPASPMHRSDSCLNLVEFQHRCISANVLVSPSDIPASPDSGFSTCNYDCTAYERRVHIEGEGLCWDESESFPVDAPIALAVAGDIARIAKNGHLAMSWWNDLH